MAQLWLVLANRIGPCDCPLIPSRTSGRKNRLCDSFFIFVLDSDRPVCTGLIDQNFTTSDRAFTITPSNASLPRQAIVNLWPEYSSALERARAACYRGKHCSGFPQKGEVPHRGMNTKVSHGSCAPKQPHCRIECQESARKIWEVLTCETASVCLVRARFGAGVEPAAGAASKIVENADDLRVVQYGPFPPSSSEN